MGMGCERMQTTVPNCRRVERVEFVCVVQVYVYELSDDDDDDDDNDDDECHSWCRKGIVVSVPYHMFNSICNNG
jgi:hypothetical protein